MEQGQWIGLQSREKALWGTVRAKFVQIEVDELMSHKISGRN